MNNIRLHHPFSDNMTAVSNYFIDYYMPQASGEYVKLYLCLLRQVAEHDNISLEAVAELFDYTERDVRRGLRYWADQGLLDLAFDSDGNISDLVFLEVQKPQAMRQAAAAVTQQPESSPRHALSKDRMSALKDQQDIRQLLFIAESYLGHSLSPGEISSLLYYYDSLHFGVDLIEYLIEYCISRGSKSFHYIDKVALAWAAEGIENTQQAKERQSQYSQKYYSILHAFGIRGRGPGKSEAEMIDHWYNDLHFTSDIILEACSRTIAQTQNPNFQYANKILESWHEKNIHHLSEIRELDQKHREKAKSAAKPQTSRTSGNKFNNFPQREYNFEELETLLNQ